MEACDSVDCVMTEQRNFTIHTMPTTVELFEPNGTIDIHTLGDNLTLSWNISEEGQNLTEHVQNCSYIYNSVEVPLNLTFCIELNQTSFLYVEGVDNLTFIVMDSFNITTATLTTWDFKVLELNQTYNNITSSGATEDFEAEIKLGTALSITGSAIVYNGTSSVGSSSTSGNITSLVVSDVLIPVVGTDTNFSFYWTLLLSDSSIVNLSTQNQTVLNIDLDNCTVFTNRIFNFTSKDEEIQNTLSNATKEIAINVYSSDRTTLAFNLSGSFTDNPTSICLNINLTGDSVYSLDTIIKYSAIGYATEYYNIVDLELANDTEEQIISLFDLNSSDSLEFQLTFTGEDFLPVENALVFVERQYIVENTFKTVELPKTDSNGQTILHLVRNDVVYNIIVMKDGVVLGRFENLVAFCEDFAIGDCKISLNAIGEDSGVPNYNEEVGILFDSAPTYNDTTKIVSFSFSSVDGSSKTVTMNVERRDVFGNTSICSNTLVSTSGTVFCSIGDISDTSLVTSVSIDEEIKLVSQVQVDTEAYGSMGYVVFFILSLTLLLIFGDSKNGIILSLLIGYIIAIAMGLVIGGLVGIGCSGTWILILTITAWYQINKNKR